jgi:rhodanese-related sulfurtransferase
LAEDKDDNELAPSRVKELVESGGAELLDVRTDHEWESGRIAGARHVELNDLPEEAERLGEGRKIIVSCRSGNRSPMAAEALRTDGFDAHAMKGGLTAWAGGERPLEPSGGYVAESGEAAAILESEGRFPVDKVDPPAEE